MIVIAEAFGVIAHILGQIRLNPNNRINSPRLARLIKLDRAIHRAVIGNRQRIHSERLAALDQIGDSISAVEQRVVGVDVEMDERTSHVR